MNILKIYKILSEWSGVLIFLSFFSVVFGLTLGLSMGNTWINLTLILVGLIYPAKLFAFRTAIH